MPSLKCLLSGSPRRKAQPKASVPCPMPLLDTKSSMKHHTSLRSGLERTDSTLSATSMNDSFNSSISSLGSSAVWEPCQVDQCILGFEPDGGHGRDDDDDADEQLEFALSQHQHTRQRDTDVARSICSRSEVTTSTCSSTNNKKKSKVHFASDTKPTRSAVRLVETSSTGVGDNKNNNTLDSFFKANSNKKSGAAGKQQNKHDEDNDDKSVRSTNSRSVFSTPHECLDEYERIMNEFKDDDCPAPRRPRHHHHRSGGGKSGSSSSSVVSNGSSKLKHRSEHRGRPPLLPPASVQSRLHKSLPDLSNSFDC